MSAHWPTLYLLLYSLHLDGHEPDIQRLHARAVPIVPNVFLALLFAISVSRGRRVSDVFPPCIAAGGLSCPSPYLTRLKGGSYHGGGQQDLLNFEPDNILYH